ncbi:hypothetical protein O1611_g574 [Lasiodiplodia mahajangana]|uniref:Uncharacterized protein n=1 Tax=Lasiodiplodia mahajangana TaxID=1108764 RepID=A0ACC2K030_9PEZI|nr:hypothetical protein O1611_g574 [Lasiodiplodia mahajangana]
MANDAVSTIFPTSTITGDPPATTLLVADTICSDIRLSSCVTPESCAIQVLPSALCWDGIHTTWSLSSVLSCGVASTSLTAPVVTSSQNFCPMGRTKVQSASLSVGSWCCPTGFTWDSTPGCWSSIAPEIAPQISSACAGGNTFALPPDTARLLKRMTEAQLWRRQTAPLPAAYSSGPNTLGNGLPVLPESATAAIFAEAIYLAEQTVLGDPIFPSYTTSSVSPSISSHVADGEGSHSQDVLSSPAKVAIGLSSAIAGTILLLLGVIFIRKHRQRKLRGIEPDGDEMASRSRCEDYYASLQQESSENLSTTRRNLRPIRPRRDLEPVSPGDSYYDDFLCLYTPSSLGPTDRERTRDVHTGERLGLDVASVSGTTFVSSNPFEPVELDASNVSQKTETLSRKNTRASSQVLPWISGTYDYWDPGSCDPERPETSERD